MSLTLDKPMSSDSCKAVEQDLICPELFGLPKVAAGQKLTPLDMNMPRLYGTRWILCFQLPSTANKIKLYNDLKVGLAYTISAIPWLGGSVEPENGTKPHLNRIQVSSEPGGVNFKYNDLTENSNDFPTYSQLKQANFPLSQLLTPTLSPLNVIPQGPQPVMAAQANFVTGGLLLAVGAHHSVCDGRAFDAILDLWAQNTCACSVKGSPVAVDPLALDRNPLMACKPGANLSEFKEYILAPTPPATISDLNTHQMAATPFQIPPLTAKIFYFSQSSLELLKTTAHARSTNDALQAFLWCHITLARKPSGTIGVHIDEEKTTALLFAADIRGRLNPPLPTNYLGNASMAGITKRVPVPAMSISTDGLISAAANIRAAVGALGVPDRVPRTIGLIASRPDPTDYKFAYNGFLGPDLSSTSWADFGIYSTEWGSLGKPEAMRIPGEGSDGTIIILPRRDSGGLEVVIGLEDVAMGRLTKDDSFVTYATLWA